MRLAVLAFLATSAASAVSACASVEARGPDAPDGEMSGPRGKPDLDAARELDQQGVRAFRDARFSDAIRYFRSAYRLGGPSSELWNVARSRERMDDAETAAGAIEQYLSQRDLGAQDRAEAERELEALRARPSVLTVITVPGGAVVTVDGKPIAAPTPVSLDLRPGPHTLAVHRDGYPTETRSLDARLGRAVIVRVDLGHDRRGGPDRR
jgi:hypothetical protein